MKKRLLTILLTTTLALSLLSGCGNKENEEPTTTVVEESTTIEEPTPAPTEEPEPTEEPSVVEEVVDEVFNSKYPQNFSEISDEDMSWAIQSGIDAVKWGEGDVIDAKRAYLIGRKNDNTIVNFYIIYEVTRTNGNQGYILATKSVEFDENRSIKNEQEFAESPIYITSFETFEEELPLRLSEPIILDVKDF